MSKLSNVLKMMTNNIETNKKIYKLHYGNSIIDGLIYEVLKYKKNKYEEKKYLLIETLLELGYDINEEYYNWGDEYIFLIFCLNISYSYSEEFLLKLFKLAIKHGVNINVKDKFNYPTNQYLLTANCKNRKITSIYKLLVDNGLDIFCTDDRYNNLIERIDYFEIEMLDKEEFIEEYTKDRKKFYKEKLDEYIKNINKKYPNLNYKRANKTTVLHDVIIDRYDDEIIYDVIKYLLDNDVNPNMTNSNGAHFIYSGISCGRLRKIDDLYKYIKLLLNYNFNINYRYQDAKTIMDYIIVHCKGNIIPIFQLLLDNGFVYNVKDEFGETFYDRLLKEDYNKILDKEEFLKKYAYLFNPTEEIVNENINEIKDIGYLYKKKKENEEILNENVNNNFIKNKCNLVIGKEGIGKTTYLNNFANHLTKNNDKVFFTSANDIINNTKSIGMTKELLMDLIHKCIDNNMILFIDDFDKLYNFKNIKYLKEELNILLNYYVNKKNLNLVISINNCNKNEILDEALIEVTSVVKIEEPNKEELNIIIDNMLKNYFNEVNMIYLDLVKQILLNILTEKNIINYENVSKLKVAKEIIEKSFNSKEKSCLENIIYAFRINQDIKPKVKEIICQELVKFKYIINVKDVKSLIKKINKEGVNNE